MDWYSPKHVEHLIENKVSSQEFCASCWFIYTLYQRNRKSLKQKISLTAHRSQFSNCCFINSPYFSTSLWSICAANSSNICRFVRFRKCTWLAVFFANRSHWGVLVNTIPAILAQVNFKTSRMQATTYLVSAARVKGRNTNCLNCMRIEVPMAISTRTLRRICGNCCS